MPGDGTLDRKIRPRRVLAAVLLVALTAPLVAGAPVGTEPAFEARENNRVWIDGEGQWNCVPEALEHVARDGCPVQPTGSARPALGVRMLDDHYLTSFGVGRPFESAQDPASGPDAGAGSNLERSSRGFVRDVVLPGAGTFRAWFGWWHDVDDDEVLEYRGTGDAFADGNEWVPIRRHHLVSYVEPGSHPGFATFERPQDSEPDFEYDPGLTPYYSARTPSAYFAGVILFTDGSLARTLQVATVTDPILAPSGENRPWTPTEDSLVDIDLYAAVAPGPVAEVFGVVLGDLVVSTGSPSLGTLAEDGGLGPRPARDTPLEGTFADPPYGAAVGAFWAPYPQEWRPGARSSNAGRGDAYAQAYTDWIDLIPGYGYGTTGFQFSAYTGQPGPLPGRSATGGQAMAPGALAFTLRVGVWRDLNLDGYVGVAKPGDPHDGGSDPRADDYASPRGEYFGIPARTPSGDVLDYTRLVLRPFPDWGAAGAFLYYRGQPDVIVEPSRAPPNPVCYSANGCLNDPGAFHVTGSRPVELNVRRDVYEAGLYRSDLLMLPLGTSGFEIEACTDTLLVTVPSHAGEVVASVWDCDVIEAFDPGP
ncbi:MAG TPA: hypothetical protein VM889_08550 [Candidatus Thermoplasmatota archaeon]|nr:hypothetical protein [Candidatus Thermoplasmatota archaeon]